MGIKAHLQRGRLADPVMRAKVLRLLRDPHLSLKEVADRLDIPYETLRGYATTLRKAGAKVPRRRRPNLDRRMVLSVLKTNGPEEAASILNVSVDYVYMMRSRLRASGEQLPHL